MILFKKFVDWSRFKLKAPKSRALVFKLGKAVKRFLDNVEGMSGNTIVLDDVDNPGGNVFQKPIKFVGRWIREDAKDTVITSEVQDDLVGQK